ncbi:MAG TPA: toll/interleukin-1 receptor domain-containing protein [Pyrinomonadaceae bacterium]|nr:toll/interleukin-1 receptor domain-containing protein [Pyrinomonadaceae bacterium]
MANPEHLEILKQGVKPWNKWRFEHQDVRPDLHDADLRRANLRRANLRDANLISANLSGADLINAHLGNVYLSNADLSFAKLRFANLYYANFNSANLYYANLTNTYLGGTNLNNAILNNTNLSNAILSDVDLSHASLSGADFTSAKLEYTTFADNDLSKVKGLETVIHISPSSIGIDTLYKSAGKIPEEFLRGCGVPDDFIAFIPSHFGVQQAIQFYSCFISYSARDEEFARRLYSRMREEKLRVWFAPEDVKGGEKLYEQIERAIQIHDRLLIVLSERSLESKWVMTEIRRARKVELRENRRKLFPIRLVDYETLQAWECFDADTGEDLASEVRQYFIPDFSNWKEHDAFEKAFERLLRDLRDEENRKPS